jgi:hypothetical protein
MLFHDPKKLGSPQRCERCDVAEGELHKYGCHWEECPFCGAQLTMPCGCVYTQLGYDYDTSKPDMGLPRKVLERDLSKAEEKRWKAILDKKGRRPFIYWPFFCGRCGEKFPRFFLVPHWIWWAVIGKENEKVHMCSDCFNNIVNFIDAGAGFEYLEGGMVPCPACKGTGTVQDPLNEGDKCWFCSDGLVGAKYAEQVLGEYEKHYKYTTSG